MGFCCARRGDISGRARSMRSGLAGCLAVVKLDHVLVH